jgi:hypothetical protein
VRSVGSSCPLCVPGSQWLNASSPPPALRHRSHDGQPGDQRGRDAGPLSCKDQGEVDYFWARLTDGGEESQCGWCKDRFGLNWQVVPDRLYDLVSHPDPARATAATQAMYGMRKIVIADLENAVAAV